MYFSEICDCEMYSSYCEMYSCDCDCDIVMTGVVGKEKKKMRKEKENEKKRQERKSYVWTQCLLVPVGNTDWY